VALGNGWGMVSTPAAGGKVFLSVPHGRVPVAAIARCSPFDSLAKPVAISPLS
jgi:hypothetical protein